MTRPVDPAHRLAALVEAERRGDKLYLVPFWSHRAARPGPGPWVLSQWWAAPFTVSGETYPSAEAYMMAAKARLFDDTETLARIRATDDPAEAKTLGRDVRGFDPAVWESHCYEVVVAANRAKFTQHLELGAYLLSTHPAVLVEASPQDAMWGIGLAAADRDARVPSRWRGRNLLGFALTEVREQTIAGRADVEM